MITKGGLETITQHLAMEYAKDGIRVNAVAPGAVYTPLHRETPKDVMIANSTTAEDRLGKLGTHLPGAPTPFGAYVPAVQTGNLLFLSGMLATSGHAVTAVAKTLTSRRAGMRRTRPHSMCLRSQKSSWVR